MDKTGADFYRCVEMIIDRVAGNPVCCQLPIGSENNFKGIIDLVRMKAVVWEDEALGAKFHDEEIPADLADKAAEYRNKLVEAAVELDDDAMAAYLDGQRAGRGDAEAPDPSRGRRPQVQPGLLRLGVQEQGVQPLLDAVVDYLPSPIDRGAIKASTSRPRKRRFASLRTRSPCRCSRSRSWTTRSSAPSPSAASIRV